MFTGKSCFTEFSSQQGMLRHTCWTFESLYVDIASTPCDGFVASGDSHGIDRLWLEFLMLTV